MLIASRQCQRSISCTHSPLHLQRSHPLLLLPYPHLFHRHFRLRLVRLSFCPTCFSASIATVHCHCASPPRGSATTRWPQTFHTNANRHLAFATTYLNAQRQQCRGTKRYVYTRRFIAVPGIAILTVHSTGVAAAHKQNTKRIAHQRQRHFTPSFRNWPN